VGISNIAEIIFCWMHLGLDNLPTICYTLNMPKMGRPKKPAKQRSSRLIAIRVTDAEYGKLKNAAGNGKVSDYIRRKLGLRGEK